MQEREMPNGLHAKGLSQVHVMLQTALGGYTT
jgi:hypothetical protein